ncbi:MAG TPA: FmdB family zinc ribbon protein [Mycobacterium sp.]|nr:FmdB family zinc ribbon protein [Mycobacterium sp.]
MPTYSYACTECGNRFDVVQAFTDDALTTCENCSGRLRKLFNSVGVVFKGSGFYRTDSRESAKSSTNGSAESSSSSGTDTSNNSDKSGSSEKSSTSSDKSDSASSKSATAAAS